MRFSDEIKKGIACDSIGKPDSAIGRAVCLSVHPGKMLIFPLRHWYNTRYHGRYKFARAVFGFDLFLIGVAVTLTVVALYASFFLPSRFENDIQFDATVAPREIVTGAPSTLVLRYTNSTKEELRNVQIAITPPKHFLLQESTSLSLGTIPIGETAAVHIKGVMFGNVGGEQAFKSKMTFVHGQEKDISGEKTDTQIFSPSRSALALTLELPERMIATQPIEGVIRYENKSEMTFPNVSILPRWPDGFTFVGSNVKQRSGQFELPAVESGKIGEIRFKGVIETTQRELTFVFEPSFAFGEERYRQEILTQTALIIPPPLTLSHSVEKQTVRPGGEVVVRIEYKNDGDVSVTDVAMSLETDSPFIEWMPTVDAKKNPALKIIEPGMSGAVELRFKLRLHIQQSQTSVYEQLLLPTLPRAIYTIEDETSARVTSKGQRLQTPIITPIVFESFARYTAVSGDQLGRGPLPPTIGKETTYWIFWHINGTTNALSDVLIESVLPEGIRFTGKQTVSQNSGVEFDPDTRKIFWTAASVPPTFAPSSKIIGVAFELGLTPTAAQKGTSPILIDQIRLSATDAWTGAFVNAAGKPLTIDLPDDARTQGKFIVK